MKRLLLLLLGCVVPVCAIAGPKEYIARYSDIAVAEMHRTGVPASITLAQGLLESAAGESPLAVSANNHFGIKCHSDWTGGTFYQDDDVRNECFRVYDTPEDSYRAHSDFLRGRSRYAELFKIRQGNYKAWANGLKSAGYATDPKYASKLIKVIEEYELYRFDSMDSPARPDGENAVASGKMEERVEPSVSGETIAVDMTRRVMTVDGRRCVVLLPGEDIDDIARQYGLFGKEIRKFNALQPGAGLEAGSLVYISRKKGKSR